ncbi:Lrp/AsnC family transcriptional regulator [Aquimarina aquimarini]|uniref:Lrp/AsnC family transcriptional regulator n=1 Tax=Aquimarina aquimarini TaxID=1191734 RepID=UPI00131EE23B|nr:Lrp/AsnC family transcriptional regulator [Aquimarina aquimarini]
MDSLNKRIIEVLRENARSSYVEIGRIVGLSAPSVADRIQKMEELGLITGYFTQLNLTKFAYHIQANIALKIDSRGFKIFVSKLSEFPEIFDCIKVTGEYCVFLKVAVKDNNQLEDLIDRLTVYGHPNTSIILSDYTDRTFFKP